MRRTMTAAVAAALVLGGGTAARAGVKTRVVEYKQGDVVLEGYLAWDDAVVGKRPGVVVVPDWMGVGPNAKKRAEMLAGLGYVALVADVYGKDVRPKNGQEAGALAGKYKGDRPLLRARINAALDELEKSDAVDPKRVAAIGYCFGGTTALELARSGAGVVGVVAFHAGLSSPTPADAKNIKGKILALQGGDDPFVPAEEVAAFEKEMRDAKVDWQLVQYGGAVHSYTIPDAGSDPTKGAAYDARADRRSWEAMRAFLREVFGEK